MYGLKQKLIGLGGVIAIALAPGLAKGLEYKLTPNDNPLKKITIKQVYEEGKLVEVTIERLFKNGDKMQEFDEDANYIIDHIVTEKQPSPGEPKIVEFDNDADGIPEYKWKEYISDDSMVIERDYNGDGKSDCIETKTISDGETVTKYDYYADGTIDLIRREIILDRIKITKDDIGADNIVDQIFTEETLEDGSKEVKFDENADGKPDAVWIEKVMELTF